MILDARFSAERLGCERVHSHDYSVVAAVENGTVQMRIAGQSVNLEKGLICFVSAGLAHQILSTSQDFSGVHVLSLSGSFLSPSGSEVAQAIVDNDPVHHRQFIRWMRRYYSADEQGKTLLFRSILQFCEQCDIALSNRLDMLRPASIHWVPSRIKDMIDSGADMGACFQFIEEHMPFSKEHCNRLFKQYYGTTIQGGVLNARTERARLLLKRGLPPAESAAEAGFYDQSQFTKAFRSIFQLTPAEYRKQVCRNFDQSDTRSIWEHTL